MKNHFETYNMCVLIPSFNHGGTVTDVIDGLLKFTDHIIVVNDGSTDDTKERLKAYETRITVITMKKNRGKGEALRRGFRHAVEQGYDRCMTIDADGQHYPEDAAVFLEYLKQYPDGLLMGTRTLDHENVPGTSSFGNKFANFWYWVITGNRLKDTQSGFRIYPMARMKKMKFYSHRYEYEAEILIRLSWREMDIVPVPIRVYYPPGDQRISHFKKVTDFTRITILNIVLLIQAILFWHPVMFIRKIRKQSLKELFKKHIVSSQHSNLRLTMALVVGVFFSVAPIWGFQMLTIVGICVLFNLNKPLSLLIAQISLPPFIPLVIYVSYLIGGYFIEFFNLGEVHQLSFDKGIGINDLTTGFGQYVLGAVLLGLILSAITFIVSFLLLNKFRDEGNDEHGLQSR